MDTDQAKWIFETIVRIRRFEETVIELFREGATQGFSHSCIGQEAVAAGACAALLPDDRITSTHRGHGHVIAKGGDTSKMLAEILGRSTGYCKGKGGELHIVDAKIGVLGANGIVGGGIPIAVGAALADSLAGRSSVTVCFFGDGATSEGVFAESVNLAALWRLPVVFLCENNLYGEFTPTRDAVAGTIAARATGYGIPGVEVDGQDGAAVLSEVARAVARARTGQGPTLVEAMTYRREGHVYGEQALLGSHSYRDEAEVTLWDRRDPLPIARQHCLDLGAKETDLETIQQSVEREIDLARQFALASPLPDPAEALEDVFADEVSNA